MSSRVLRKLGLQGEKDLTCLADDGSDTEADFSSSGGAKKKQLNINRYEMLNQQSHSESEVKEDDDHETTGSLNAQDHAAEGKEATRRKKKKKRKKPGKIPNNARSSEDNIEDEVERSVREVFGETLGLNPSIVGSNGEPHCGAYKKGVLSIEHKALNPNNEIKRIFGLKILQNDQSKRRGRNRGHLKATWLVSVKENWPQVGKPGLSMRLVESKNGQHYFTYEHSINYQQVQMKFLEAVESLHPDNIVAIINTHPYHVDALLQLSDLCRLSEDMAMAAELIERALFCLECAFHPAFNLAAGNCRLDYRKQENRALYIALFKHLTFVGARACYRTALEFCKLLLSLDPEEDPLAIILAVDFYALRAQQYEWLIRIAQEWEISRNLSQLPNFAFSLAVAEWQVSVGRNHDAERAHSFLQNALLMFPSVLLPLLEKCGVQPDPRVLKHPFFNEALNSESDSLRQLARLYISRCYHVWKESELMPWLERNVHAVLDRVDANDPIVAEFAAKRQKRYLTTPRNILRHILLADPKDVSAALYDRESLSPVMSFDPLPPLDSINLYTRPQRPRMIEEESNAFSMFFRSFMPNFNPNQPVSDDPAEESGEGATVDLRRSVTSLLDAMRDLLSNINMPNVPGDGDVEDGDSEEDQLPP